MCRVSMALAPFGARQRSQALPSAAMLPSSLLTDPSTREFHPCRQGYPLHSPVTEPPKLPNVAGRRAKPLNMANVLDAAQVAVDRARPSGTATILVSAYDKLGGTASVQSIETSSVGWTAAVSSVMKCMLCSILDIRLAPSIVMCTFSILSHEWRVHLAAKRNVLPFQEILKSMKMAGFNTCTSVFTGQDWVVQASPHQHVGQKHQGVMSNGVCNTHI
jgi:hypothetical protein